MLFKIRSKSPQYNQQTEECEFEIEEICVFTKTWKVAVTALVAISENK